MKKNIIIPLFILLLSASAVAQNTIVHFAYDGNGNRIIRSLSVRKTEENGKPIDSLKTFEHRIRVMDTLGQASLALYPNPTQSQLTVELQGLDSDMVNAIIVSAAGAIVEQTSFADGTHVFDLSGLPSGIYLLQLSTPKVSQTWKIIKK